MLLYLLVAVLILPFLDIYLLIEAAGMLGIVPTLILVLFTGVAGAYLLKRELGNVGRKLFRSVTAREVSRNILEAFLLVIGGICLLTPGFITDIIGFGLVFRPLRIKLTIRLEEKLKERSDFKVQVQSF
jgi:UPF0716 protein FxsA